MSNTFKIGKRVHFMKDGDISDTGTVDLVCGDIVWVRWDSDGQRKCFILDDERFQLMSTDESTNEMMNEMMNELTDVCIQVLQTSHNIRKHGVVDNEMNSNPYTLQLRQDIKKFNQVTLRLVARGILTTKKNE